MRSLPKEETVKTLMYRLYEAYLRKCLEIEDKKRAKLLMKIHEINNQ